MGRKQLKALADRLAIFPLPDGPEDPFGRDPPGLVQLNELFDAARADLAKVPGLVEFVEKAIQESLILACQGRRLEGTKMLIDACLAVKEGRVDLDQVQQKVIISDPQERQSRRAAEDKRRIERSLARKPRDLRSAFDSEGNLKPDIVDPQASPLQQADQLAAYLRGRGVSPPTASRQADDAVVEQFFKREYQHPPPEQLVPLVTSEIGTLIERAIAARAAETDPEFARQQQMAGVLERVANVQGMLEQLERSAGVSRETGGGEAL